MLVKFFARGTGGGRGPVEYITRRDDPSTGSLRSPAPEVLRGNPVITRRLIDGLEFKHKYRSGVLSFATEDAPTDQQIEALIDSFEEYAFAGLNKDAYNTLWVKHTHTENNRVELHFVTPRVELYTGKSLNIAPPGWHGYFKPWQTNWNISQGWARPDDPARKRIYEPGFQALINADREAKGNEPIADTRKLLTEYVIERVSCGLINNRNDIIELFKEELGLEITRAGFDYITVLDPKTEIRCRLKGKLYEREFRPQPEITAEIRPGATSNSRVNSKELPAITKRIKSNYKYRYKYHQKRYGASKLGSELDAGQVLANSSLSGIEPLSGYLRRQLGDDAIFIESDNRETGDVRLSGQENQFPGNRVETATTDSGFTTRVNRGDNYHSNGQWNISDSSSLLNSEPWLAMPGKTLYEIVALKDIALKDTPSDIPLWYTPSDIEDERTGKQINDR
ncbi:MAG: relaxase/mobilization nuclease domain-containing protein, partial [Waterburya sp.]